MPLLTPVISCLLLVRGRFPFINKIRGVSVKSDTPENGYTANHKTHMCDALSTVPFEFPPRELAKQVNRSGTPVAYAGFAKGGAFTRVDQNRGLNHN